MIDSLLQFFKEMCGMPSVHLGMMELKGDGERGFQPTLAIAAPGQEGIGEDAAVLVDDAVEFRPGQSRCAHDDSILVQNVLTGLANGLSQVQVVGVELLQIIRDGNVAETESTFDVIYDHVDSHAVVFVQFPVMWQHIELLYPGGRLANAPAEQHIELQSAPPADPAESRHVEGLSERHHRHGRLHPQFERHRPTGFFGIDFLFHHFIIISSISLPVLSSPSIRYVSVPVT